MTGLPLERTSVPGRVSARFVVVYRRTGRPRKQAAATLAEARAIKLERDAEARAERRGPTLHAYALAWLDRYAGSGRDSARAEAGPSRYADRGSPSTPGARAPARLRTKSKTAAMKRASPVGP